MLIYRIIVGKNISRLQGPYRKNDNCFVEEKNYSVVRRAVGYLRYDTPKEMEIMNELYRVLRLYTNFFLPSMKLKEKTRIGSRLIKKHDIPKTPYRRIIESPDISEEVKEKLMETYESLNPALLKRNIDKLKREVERAYEIKMEKRKRETQKEPGKLSNNLTAYKNNFVYNLDEATRPSKIFFKNVRT